MAKEIKTTIIKEALADYNAIKEAADKNALKKLSTEFPEKFNELLNEELNKNNIAKESYKKIDEAKESNLDDTKSKKESDMTKEVKETVKVVDTVGNGEPFEEKPKEVKEDVKVTNTVGKSDPFEKKSKVKQPIEEEREKGFMADVEGETPNQAKGETAKGDAFKEKLKGPTSGKPISNIKEEFNISELDINSVGSALENADDDDVISIDEIESEITQMEELGEEINTGAQPVSIGSPENQNGDPFSELISMRNKLDEMIKNMGSAQTESEEINTDVVSPVDGGVTTSLEEEESTDEITDDDINAVLGATPDEVDEAHGVSHSAGKGIQSVIPKTDYLSTAETERRRFKESDVKLGSLIEENKKLTKKLNESKKYKTSVSTLVESYKNALGKYRNQLKEMAIFNTNLAHVNNLLVNESLALTQDDKINIINGFKKVETISESQETYKTFLSEMKDSKKTITESVETKVSTSIQPSSKQKLDEVVETKAYENDEHINKMKKLIEYVENRGKKII